MQLEEANGAGRAEVELTPAELLEAEIDREIGTVRASILAKTQPGEVAVSFLLNARSLARDGKLELAERKRKAAKRVLNGGGEDE